MKIIGIIPARYQSSRFPGKPLVNLLGKPMVIYVCEVTAKALGIENTYVATDSREIADVVTAHGYNVLMTSVNCLTGTDRLAEAIGQLSDVEMIINIQGDEPMVAPESIMKVRDLKASLPGYIVNGMARVGLNEDPHSLNMPKVVVSESHKMLYMSRALLPASKAGKGIRPECVWKQVCIYAFEPGHLEAFASFGRKSYNEGYEDIEILRFLDIGIPVQMIELPPASYAVDHPDDIAVVEQALRGMV